jgi:hypothetical protein
VSHTGKVKTGAGSSTPTSPRWISAFRNKSYGSLSGLSANGVAGKSDDGEEESGGTALKTPFVSGAAPGDDKAGSTPAAPPSPSSVLATAAAAGPAAVPAAEVSSSSPAAAAGDGELRGGCVWRVYLAVKFTSWHPLKSKVEKDTLNTAGPLYTQMMDIAEQWLRDPAARVPMAVVLPQANALKGEGEEARR